MAIYIYTDSFNHTLGNLTTPNLQSHQSPNLPPIPRVAHSPTNQQRALVACRMTRIAYVHARYTTTSATFPAMPNDATKAEHFAFASAAANPLVTMATSPAYARVAAPPASGIPGVKPKPLPCIE